MLASSTDRQLWEASRQGHQEAFVELVTRHQTAVCAVTYAQTGSQTLSEDLAQDTFLAAWRGLDRVRDPDRLAAWLCGIARNLARRARRSSRPRPVADVEDVPGSDPEDDLVAREAAVTVWDALAELPPRYREPLVLYYRQGKSAREVAEQLGLSLAAVDQRLSRGRKRLRAEVMRNLEPELAASGPDDRFRRRVAAALPALVPGEATGGGPSTFLSSLLGATFMKRLAIASVVPIAAILLAVSLPGASSGPGTAAAAHAGAAPRDGRGSSHDLEDARRERDRLRRETATRAAAPAPSLHSYELSRLGNRVTVNLDGGPSAVYSFGRGEGGMVFEKPGAKDGPDAEKFQQYLAVARRAYPDQVDGPTRTIDGLVLDTAGRPIHGAVVLAGNGIDFDFADAEPHATADHGTVTDEGGRFELDLPTRASLSLSALAADGWSGAIRLEAGSESASVELRLDAVRRIEGRTTRNGDGHPATLALLNHKSRLTYRVTAGLDGRFVVERVTPGAYTVVAMAETGADAPRTPHAMTELVVEPDRDTTLELELPRGGLIAARVVLPAGIESGGIRVNVYRGRQDPSGSASNLPSVTQTLRTFERRADADQLLEFGDLEDGTYTVCAEVIESMRPTADPESGAARLDADSVGSGCATVELATTDAVTELQVVVERTRSISTTRASPSIATSRSSRAE